ncbi:MAG: DNA/RNA non-specific endonuclease [Candidatus Cryptobacteroides sp.]
MTRLAVSFFVALSVLLVSCSGSDSAVLRLESEQVSADAGFQRLSVTTSGDWTLEMNYGGNQDGWARLDYSSGTSEDSSVRLVYDANTGEERSLELILSCGSARSRKTMTQAAPRQGSGGNTGGSDNTGGSGNSGGDSQGSGMPVPAGWMELPDFDPAQFDGRYDYYNHHMKVGKVLTRSYSYLWSYDDRVSLWVAYPLSNWNIGANYGRSDAWAFDPNFSASKQSDVSKGFSNGSDGRRYDRGHMLPSASRQGSYANNAQTFYGTNMTPQFYGFNQNIWADLEIKVRNWASKSDTLYVITGCQVDGADSYVRDASANKVTIPVSYYKAVLRYKTSSTIGYGNYAGCAFFFDHDEYSSASKYDRSISKSMAISISELEAKLGFRLFDALDEALGEDTAGKVRKQDPKSVDWWW